MEIGENGLTLIKGFEGIKLTAYKCPAGIWTIGYGHTGADVYEGFTITPAKADSLLVGDLNKFCSGVTNLVNTATQNQFDALVCFAYNVGLGSLGNSTLLKLHNAGDYAGAAGQFVRWNKAGGKVLAGLTRRREAEARLYQS